MNIAFVERPPSWDEIERLRLVLSTFQDGSGMNAIKTRHGWHKENHAQTTPGWRDFERAVAVVFGGIASENKHVYDVSFRRSDAPDVMYGVSCKMRSELRLAATKGRAYIELTNAAQALWSAVRSATGLGEETYTSDPAAVGIALVEQVEIWHLQQDIRSGGSYDTDRCVFLNLLYDNRHGNYRLFQFPIRLPKPQELEWESRGKTIVGRDDRGTVFEWYAQSGGQLKYYPQTEQATWSSDEFHLETLPDKLEEVTLQKAAAYFPEQWRVLP